MKQWSESELHWYLERLGNNDTQNVAGALFEIADIRRHPQPQPVPTGDARVVAYLEKLIDNRRACIVNWIIPYTYGELRWLAAWVLACEYSFLGIAKPVMLKDVIQPIKTTGGLYSIDTLNERIQNGLLPTITEIMLGVVQKKLSKNVSEIKM